MQWWNDVLSWFSSNDGQTVITSAIVPFVAILVAGIVAAAIGRGSTKRLLTLNDRENRIAAVATMIGAARRASVWNTLPLPEQQHADHVASEADVRVRLLAVPGSGLAADWATHEIATMKKNSVSFSFQAEQSLIEFRDRMVTWQAKPSRARKLFKADLESWAYDDAQNKSDIVSQQQAWAAAQVKNETGPIATVKPSAADAAAARAPQSFAPTAAAPAAGAAVATSPPPAAAAAAASASSAADGVTDSSDTPSASAPMDRPSFRPAATVPVRDASDNEDSSAKDDDSAPATDDTSASQSAQQLDADGRPVLVEPRAQSDDDDDDEPGRSLEDALYSPPVTANTVSKRINPPQIGDDGRSR